MCASMRMKIPPCSALQSAEGNACHEIFLAEYVHDHHGDGGHDAGRHKQVVLAAVLALQGGHGHREHPHFVRAGGDKIDPQNSNLFTRLKEKFNN